MNQNTSFQYHAAGWLRAVTKTSRKAWLTTAAVAMVTASPAMADIYISTFGQLQEIGGAGVGVGNWVGFTFATDGQDYYLEDIDALLYTFQPDAGDWDLNPRLYTANSNGIPQILAPVSFTHTALAPIGEQTISFTPDASFQLAANTHYTFVLTPTELEVALLWRLTPQSTGFSTEVPGSNWQMPPALIHSVNSGAIWTNLSSDYRMITQVGAAPVPEPSTLALLAAAGLMGAGVRRRRAGLRDS